MKDIDTQALITMHADVRRDARKLMYANPREAWVLTDLELKLRMELRHRGIRVAA